MAESKAQGKAKRTKAKASRKTKTTAKAKATAKRKAGAATGKRATGKRKAPATAARTGAAGARSRRTSSTRGRGADVPRDVLKSVEDGQRAAVDAVRRFIETVDRALPIRESRAAHTRRQEIVDSAMEMADRLVQTQYDLLRKAVRSASRTFGDSVKRR
jgi:hypothetical protein